MCLFTVKNYNIRDKKRKLEITSSGKVSSTKYFPIFEENNKEYIFKPLSKTKPLSTPLFAYSEVYWSYLLRKYIDSRTPQYTLAICKGLSNEQEKYYEKGTIVENILSEDERLINILELYRKYPDNIVNINDYINYCERQYDYSDILNSTFFTENKELGRKLSEQILSSILRRDDNYHYENVSLIEKNNKIVDLAPMIDMEFSEMFMYPDDEQTHKRNFSNYDESSSPFFKYDEKKSYEENYDLFIKKAKDGCIYDHYGLSHTTNIRKNIKTIVELHPDVALDFINKLSNMRKEVEELTIDYNDDFLGRFSSCDWEPNKLIIKEKVSKKDIRYLSAKERADKAKISLDKKNFNEQLKKEVLWSIDKLTEILKLYLDIYNNKLIDIKSYENKTLYGKIKRTSEEELEVIINFFEGIDKKNTRKF